MSLEEIIKLIKSFKLENIIFKHHSRDRIIQRNFNIDTIKYYLLNEAIVGIHKQNNNVYKLWFQYTISEDLTVVVNIKENKLFVITTIKESNIKRLKNGKS